VKQYNHSLVVLILFLIGGGGVATADAYVLKGPQILELMARDYGRPARLAVTQNVFIYRHAGDPPFRLRESLKYDFPDKFRSDIFFDDSKRTYVSARDEIVTIFDGKPAIPAFGEKRDFDCYKEVILFRSASALQARLAKFGIDFAVSSLGRFKQKTVYVIGANYPDITAMQIWLDKDTFRPFRWILEGTQEKSGSIPFEIQYHDWLKKGSQPPNQLWYPGRIQFYQYDTLVREIVVDDIEVNPTFTEDFFDIQAIKAAYPPSMPKPSGQRTSEGIHEIQKAIREFRKKFE
jgi:hypothetical protein